MSSSVEEASMSDVSSTSESDSEHVDVVDDSEAGAGDAEGDASASEREEAQSDGSVSLRRKASEMHLNWRNVKTMLHTLLTNKEMIEHIVKLANESAGAVEAPPPALSLRPRRHTQAVDRSAATAASASAASSASVGLLPPSQQPQLQQQLPPQSASHRSPSPSFPAHVVLLSGDLPEDEDDDEYNYMEDAINEPDMEEFRSDRAVRVSRKELLRLMEDDPLGSPGPSVSGQLSMDEGVLAPLPTVSMPLPSASVATPAAAAAAAAAAAPGALSSIIAAEAAAAAVAAVDGGGCGAGAAAGAGGASTGQPLLGTLSDAQLSRLHDQAAAHFQILVATYLMAFRNDNREAMQQRRAMLNDFLVQANFNAPPEPDTFLFPRPLHLPESAEPFVPPLQVGSPFLVHGLHLLPTLFAETEAPGRMSGPERAEIVAGLMMRFRLHFARTADEQRAMVRAVQQTVLTQMKEAGKAFVKLEDELLLRGVWTYGDHRWEAVAKHFLPHRSAGQLAVRHKNLLSQRAGPNPFKSLRARLRTRMLTDAEHRLVMATVHEHGRGCFAVLQRLFPNWAHSDMFEYVQIHLRSWQPAAAYVGRRQRGSAAPASSGTAAGTGTATNAATGLAAADAAGGAGLAATAGGSSAASAAASAAVAAAAADGGVVPTADGGTSRSAPLPHSLAPATASAAAPASARTDLSLALEGMVDRIMKSLRKPDRLAPGSAVRRGRKQARPVKRATSPPSDRDGPSGGTTNARAEAAVDGVSRAVGGERAAAASPAVPAVQPPPEPVQPAAAGAGPVGTSVPPLPPSAAMAPSSPQRAAADTASGGRGGVAATSAASVPSTTAAAPTATAACPAAAQTTSQPTTVPGAPAATGSAQPSPSLSLMGLSPLPDLSGRPVAPSLFDRHALLSTPGDSLSPMVASRPAPAAALDMTPPQSVPAQWPSQMPPQPPVQQQQQQQQQPAQAPPKPAPKASLTSQPTAAGVPKARLQSAASTMSARVTSDGVAGATAAAAAAAAAPAPVTGGKRSAQAAALTAAPPATRLAGPAPPSAAAVPSAGGRRTGLASAPNPVARPQAASTAPGTPAAAGRGRGNARSRPAAPPPLVVQMEGDVNARKNAILAQLPTLPQAVLQAVMDRLWSVGVRPTGVVLPAEPLPTASAVPDVPDVPPLLPPTQLLPHPLLLPPHPAHTDPPLSPREVDPALAPSDSLLGLSSFSDFPYPHGPVSFGPLPPHSAPPQHRSTPPLATQLPPQPPPLAQPVHSGQPRAQPQPQPQSQPQPQHQGYLTAPESQQQQARQQQPQQQQRQQLQPQDPEDHVPVDAGEDVVEAEMPDPDAPASPTVHTLSPRPLPSVVVTLTGRKRNADGTPGGGSIAGAGSRSAAEIDAEAALPVAELSLAEPPAPPSVQLSLPPLPPVTKVNTLQPRKRVALQPKTVSG